MSWYVYTHPNYTSFALPEMPDSIREDFNLPYNIQYMLEGVEILDYPDLEGYEEVIETVFQSNDDFYNLASGGVMVRVRQTGSLSKGYNRVTGKSGHQGWRDPMDPIP